MNVFDVGMDLATDTWTADWEGAYPELDRCPHDNSCVGCRGTEMAASRFLCTPDAAGSRHWQITV